MANRERNLPGRGNSQGKDTEQRWSDKARLEQKDGGGGQGIRGRGNSTRVGVATQSLVGKESGPDCVGWEPGGGDGTED